MSKSVNDKSTKPGTLILTIVLSSLTLFSISTITTIKLLTNSKSVSTPDLVHKSVESARSICRVKRLKINIKEYRFDERIPANIILDQDPQPKEDVKTGRLMNVIVSRGSRSVKNPTVLELSLREATLMIENAGLHVGRVTRLYDPTIPKDIILDQWPAPEQDITHGDKINLLISNGLKPVWFLMPLLQDKHIDESANTLEKLGLQLSEIKRTVDNTKPSGTIIAQTPPAGARVKAGMPAGLIATKRSDNQNLISRFVTIKYHIPRARRDVRIKILASDDSGLHEIYNAMEKPDSDLLIRRTLVGPSAKLKFYVNGKLLEERDI